MKLFNLSFLSPKFYKYFFLLFYLIAVSICGDNSIKDVISFSHKHGFYYEPFILNIESQIPNVTLRYTLDGSIPYKSVTAKEYPDFVTIDINPEITEGRDKSPGIIVRVCAILNDSLLGKIETQTYLFPELLVELSENNTLPGADWLDFGMDQQINYGLDPAIYNDPLYKDYITESFLSIPTISLVTDLKNLFDPDSGIYVNAFKRGREWERFTSVEILNPNGEEGIQANCGLRIRGGWSRRPINPKHAFRLFFREEYGDNKLNYPLFGEEGVNEFDNIDLRTSQNYSWAYEGDTNNTFLRDVFSRDTQRDMNQPYTRSIFYHLFINGTYWGLYQTQERSEASYAETYFGGDKTDYDVIKVKFGENFYDIEIEATDGNLNKWMELWYLCQSGFEKDEDYFKAQGMGPDGSLRNEYDKLVDVNNLIDYMIITFFVGDFDGPVSAWRENNSPNNFYAILNRNNPSGFKFFRHDAEHSLFLHDWGIDRTGPYTAGEKFLDFNPQWLHQQLSENEKYRISFNDRVHKHFFDNGSLSEERINDRLNVRKNEIELAIIAESARWGDSKRQPALNKNDWEKAVRYIYDKFLPGRDSILLSQLENKGLYNNIPRPSFSTQSGIVDVGTKISLSSALGEIYYTTDNSDPVFLSSSVVQYNEPIIIEETVTIRARTRTNLGFGALSEAKYIIDENFAKLMITELHYHPLDSISDQDTISGREFEFVELKNVGEDKISLAGSSFNEGIYFDFPQNSDLLPDSFFVIASNRFSFEARYGFDPNYEFDGQLDNGGEMISLESATGEKIISFTYDDNIPWPIEADGLGYSLVLNEQSSSNDPNKIEYWKLSSVINGTPGNDDLQTTVGGIFNKRLKYFTLSQNYPNPFNPNTTIRYTIPTLVNSEWAIVNLVVYDVLGRKVEILVNEKQKPGYYEVEFSAKGGSGSDGDGSELTSGIYFYRLRAGDYVETKKMVLIK